MKIESATCIVAAIKRFEDELKDGACSPNCPACNANKFALAALREQQEQEEATRD